MAKHDPNISWSQLMSNGVETNSGHLNGWGALLQVITLPVCLIIWTFFALLLI